MAVLQGGRKARYQTAQNTAKTILISDAIRTAAVAVALRQFAECGGARLGKRRLDLTKGMVHVAALLAFRRFLAWNRVPSGIYCPDPLAASPHFEVALGGLPVLLARCRDRAGSPYRLADLEAEWIEKQSGVSRAIVVFYAASGPGEGNADQAPVCFVAPMPLGWAQPQRWGPMKNLQIRLEGSGPVRISLTGLDSRRCFRSKSILVKGCDSPIPPEWYTLSALCTNRRPQSRLQIFGPRRGEKVTIAPGAWHDISSALSSCVFFGYASLRALRGARSVEKVPLFPLDDLFARVFEWDRSNDRVWRSQNRENQAKNAG